MKKVNSVSEFESIVKEGKILIDFYADWCGPCKMMEPNMIALEKQGIAPQIIKVNVDMFESLANTFGIQSIPTLIMFEDGKEIKRQVGFQSTAALEKFVK